MNPSSPTLRDIAKVCQVSHTAVSLALKNSPEISLQKRRAIQEMAQKMGYQVDANVTKLMGYLRNRKKRQSLCNLAWLNTSSVEKIWHNPWSIKFLEGARQRAEDLGYALEEIWVGDPQFRMERLPKILAARGIEGIVLALPGLLLRMQDYLDWEAVQAVVVNSPTVFPNSNHVNPNYSANVHLALEKIIGLGYRRPALMTSRWVDVESNWAYSAGMLVDYGPDLKFEHITPFWTEGWEGETWQAKNFQRWFKSQRPDVLFVVGNEWKANVEAMGIRIPEDVGMVNLHWGQDVSTWAGIDLHREKIGGAAVDILVAYLMRGEKGVPAFAQEIQIRGQWQMGCTVRSKV